MMLPAVAVFVCSCASPQIPAREVTKSDPAAKALVAASQTAHGKKAFEGIRDVSVRYNGRWASLGPRFQPVLADTKFRRSSEERFIVKPNVIAQAHDGPGGKKMVVRSPGKVSVVYNGERSEDQEVQRAAALVADAYTMFLLGPFYFSRRGVYLERDGEAIVAGAKCDRVLAVLRPGFGFAAEDRVLLFIDRDDQKLRRVRMTLNGLESTQGAEVELTFDEWRRIGGVLWPTDFDERIRVPFNLHAHHWRLEGLELNRGLRLSELRPEGFGGRASKPAASIP